MITKEDILEGITGALSSDKPTHSINIPIGWIYQAMQQYAEEYHQSELLKLNKSDVSVSVCKCKKPILIATVHPLPDICDYCRKQIIQTEH